MSDRTARRYARALFDLAHEAQQVEQVIEGLQSFAHTLAENPRIREFLQDPTQQARRKGEVVAKTLGQQAPPLLAEFIKLVVRNGRVEQIPEILEETRTLWDRARGILHVLVETPFPLVPSQKEDLSKKLSQWTGKTIVLDEEVDKSWLGGLVIHVEGNVLDGSLKTRLSRLSHRLKEIAYGRRL